MRRGISKKRPSIYKIDAHSDGKIEEEVERGTKISVAQVSYINVASNTGELGEGEKSQDEEFVCVTQVTSFSIFFFPFTTDRHSMLFAVHFSRSASGGGGGNGEIRR